MWVEYWIECGLQIALDRGCRTGQTVAIAPKDRWVQGLSAGEALAGQWLVELARGVGQRAQIVEQSERMLLLLLPPRRTAVATAGKTRMRWHS